MLSKKQFNVFKLLYIYLYSFAHFIKTLPRSSASMNRVSFYETDSMCNINQAFNLKQYPSFVFSERIDYYYDLPLPFFSKLQLLGYLEIQQIRRLVYNYYIFGKKKMWFRFKKITPNLICMKSFFLNTFSRNLLYMPTVLGKCGHIQKKENRLILFEHLKYIIYMFSLVAVAVVLGADRVIAVLYIV